MRVLSLLIAALVVLSLYLWVFERDRLYEIAGRVPEATAAPEVPPAAEPEPDAAPEAGAAPFAVVAVRSAAREIDRAVVLRGRTEAARQVEVRAETAGRVVSEPIRKGRAVEAGEVLCRLDPGTREAALVEAEARLPEAEARLAEAQARLEEAEINARAATRLQEGGFASETRVAAAAAGIEAARAAVETARSGLAAADAARAVAAEELTRLEIRAPFAGLLESDTAELGALLQPGSPCATIVALDPVKLVGFVPETDVARVQVGAAATARLASGREAAGIVTFVSRSADPTTRTFRVEVEVPNGDRAIRDGETAEFAVAAPGEPAHLLPQSSLTLDDDGALGVRLVGADGMARFAAVSLLRDTREGVWLTGLPAEAAVIVVGQDYVTDGVPVNAVFREAIP